MSGDYDYLSFRDDMLVGIADIQEPPGLGEVDVVALAKHLKISAQESWLMLICRDLAEQGFGRDRSTLKNRLFLINGTGLARATELRRQRRIAAESGKGPPVDWTKWGTVIAAVSLVASIFLWWLS